VLLQFWALSERNVAGLVNWTISPYPNTPRSFTLWGNHPRPPPNKYNTLFGKKCVAIAHATFFVTFDDFEND
jgi:hypothetical protein